MPPKQFNALLFHFIALTYIEGLPWTIIEENDGKNHEQAWKMLMPRFPWKERDAHWSGCCSC